VQFLEYHHEGYASIASMEEKEKEALILLQVLQ
jgi:hypothetical protein